MTPTTTVSAIDATFLFLAGAGIVMSFTLALWHQLQNGNRHIPSWIIWLQATGWSLLLGRLIYADLQIADTAHPPVWFYVLGVGLMDAAQLGHIYYLMRRKKFAYENGSHK